MDTTHELQTRNKTKQKSCINLITFILRKVYYCIDITSHSTPSFILCWRVNSNATELTKLTLRSQMFDNGSSEGILNAVHQNDFQCLFKVCPSFSNSNHLLLNATNVGRMRKENYLYPTQHANCKKRGRTMGNEMHCTLYQCAHIRAFGTTQTQEPGSE